MQTEGERYLCKKIIKRPSLMSLHILHINERCCYRPIRDRLWRDIRLQSRMRHCTVVVAVMLVRTTGTMGGRAVDSAMCALGSVGDVGRVVERDGVEADAVGGGFGCVRRGGKEWREEEGEEGDHLVVEGGHLYQACV